jgi:hypothetical protein
MRRNVIRVNRLALQLFEEVQQQLCQIARGLKSIRARPVVSLLEPLQFQVQAQIFHMQIVGPLLLFFNPPPLFFETALLIVAFLKQRAHHRSERFTIIG